MAKRMWNFVQEFSDENEGEGDQNFLLPWKRCYVIGQQNQLKMSFKRIQKLILKQKNKHGNG